VLQRVVSGHSQDLFSVRLEFFYNKRTEITAISNSTFYDLHMDLSDGCKINGNFLISGQGPNLII